MSNMIDTQPIYDSLKDFQKDTVCFAYKKLQENYRYLIADEVGLGKTMIAKGIIAKIFDELKDNQKKIEIVYITSNQSIASQNIETLKIGNAETTSHRLTLHASMPKIIQKINFMSFTVGTSIEIRGAGNHDERNFLVYLLRHEKYGLLKGIREETIWKFFKQGVDDNKVFKEDNNFKISKKELREKFVKNVEDTFIKNFCKSVQCNYEIKRKMGNIRNLNDNVQQSRNIIEILRKILLIENLNNIQADLIIMDEFQRFNQVFDTSKQEDSGLKDIMKILFSQNTKVLLLSATPYKLLDCKNSEHYDEFYSLIKWLYKNENENKITKLKSLFLDLHKNENNRIEIENILKKVMCRTERVTHHSDGMVDEKVIENLNLKYVMKKYLLEYEKYYHLNISGVTRYLKSAPSPLNYMKRDNYVAKREFLKLTDENKSIIKEDNNHPKFKMLKQEVENQGLKKFIWMPPLNPYVKTRGISSTQASKMLIFTQWNFAPDSLVGAFSIKKWGKSNYTDVWHFTEREKLLMVTSEYKKPYDYDGILSFTALVNRTISEYELPKLDAKILLGSPANVIYRSIHQYGNIKNKNIIKEWVNYNKNNWHISESFLHFIGRNENYKKMKIINSKNKLIEILDYCIKNNIQSMMDEYMHQLTDSPRYKNITDDAAKMKYLYDIFETVFKLAVNKINYYSYKNNESTEISKISKFSMRISKSSMRDNDNKDERPPTSDNVKTSFNSPFAPFILVTTSIGQEGLDFHPYCNQIWHWDLPSNPVDMEQREGRIHRYKNYAVRKNIAKSYSHKCWIEKFKNAREDKGCDLETFWLFTTEDAIQKIERVVPIIPLSKEAQKYIHLKSQLKLYRTAIGQERQDDIMNNKKELVHISLKPDKREEKCLD